MLRKKKSGDQTENKTAISVDFEALFIPDSASRVKLITSQLDYYNVKGFQLLGTSLWHSPDLLKNGTEYLEEAIFANSFFTNSIYPETNNFVDVYYTKYNREPENIEALAYDTAGIIIDVLDDMEIKTRAQFVAALKKVGNYEGVTGKTSFDSDRVAQKTPFILKVNKGKLKQVK
jgi:ABC-type branched-subunit amino acid transport system substrate-binding protein